MPKYVWKPISVDDEDEACCSKDCPYLRKTGPQAQYRCLIFGKNHYGKTMTEKPKRNFDCRSTTKTLEEYGSHLTLLKFDPDKKKKEKTK